MIISYAEKKSKGSKVVLFVTTMFDEMRVSKDLRLKPQPIVYYDPMKGGVDIVDQLSSSVTTHSKNKR